MSRPRRQTAQGRGGPNPGMTWRTAPAPMRIEPREVHVWRARLDSLPEDHPLAEALSEDERRRALRFRAPLVRARFTAARAILRAILGSCLECPPEQLRFGYRERGKPCLAPGAFQGDIRFNLSHSHGLALFAVARGAEVGIDLECIRADRDHERLAARFFSPAESAALTALPLPERVEAFFHCWTRKEAYLKARGEGLAVPLASFSVSLAPGAPAALLEVAGDQRETLRWWLTAVDAGPGFAAALAVEGGPLSLRLWDWHDPPAEPSPDLSG